MEQNAVASHLTYKGYLATFAWILQHSKLFGGYMDMRKILCKSSGFRLEVASM
jgi:hypothetical protein